MGETLIGAVAILAIGSVLTLERRCLGQMAIVQPLTVCLVAGWLAGNDVGIWLGISLQLFSTATGQQVDWSLAGVIAAVSIFVATHFEIPMLPGGATANGAAMVAILAGKVSVIIERRYAQIDGERLDVSHRI